MEETEGKEEGRRRASPDKDTQRAKDAVEEPWKGEQRGVGIVSFRRVQCLTRFDPRLSLSPSTLIHRPGYVLEGAHTGIWVAE